MSLKIQRMVCAAAPAIFITGINSTALAEPKESSGDKNKLLQAGASVDSDVEEAIRLESFEKFVNFLGLSSRIVDRHDPVEGTTNCLLCGSSL